MLKQKHDPEKWTPVFRKDHAQTKARDAGCPIETIARPALKGVHHETTSRSRRRR
jgi:hypothetical protein